MNNAYKHFTNSQKLNVLVAFVGRGTELEVGTSGARRGRPPQARDHWRRGRGHRRTLQRTGIPCATACPTPPQPSPTPIPPTPRTDRRRSAQSADGEDGRRELVVLGTGLTVVDAMLRWSASPGASGSPPPPHCLRDYRCRERIDERATAGMAAASSRCWAPSSDGG